MKKLYSFFILFVLGLLFPFFVLSQTVDNNTIDGQLYFQVKNFKDAGYKGTKGVVSLNQLTFLNQLIDKYQIKSAERPFYYTNDSKLERTYLLHFKDYKGIDSLIAKLSKDPNIVYAEKAPIFKILFTPDDPDYSVAGPHSWFLNVIKASSAWNIQKGNPKIKIAVLDNGVDVSHPDLKSQIVAKIDLANGDDDPTPPKKTMDWSHGTHVSGLASATTNNGIGVASIGFNTSLIAVKISPDSTDGSKMYFGYQGIVWAADHHADVINMSWGGSGYYQTGQNVVNYAYNKGCVMVASAGNDGNQSITYPAGYNHVISVASTNSDDAKSSFSQYGKTIDLCAPGGRNDLGAGMYSTVYLANSDYGYMQGTSMASPVVAGLCGLMLSQDSLLTPEKLTAILKVTCDNIDAVNKSYIGKLGAGRINAYKAVNAVKDSMALHNIIANFQASSISVPEGGYVSFTDLSTGNPVKWQWSFPGGNPAASTEQNPSNIQYNSPGTYQVSLTVTNGSQSNTETKTNFIVVYPLKTGAWLPQATGFSEQSRGINHIFIVNPDIVWANAYDGSGKGANILDFSKTSDGGKNWKPGYYKGVPTAYAVSSISAIDDKTAWISTYNNVSGSAGHGGIYATTDGGINWSHQSSALYTDAAAFPNIVYFWDKNNGVCQGDPTNGSFEIYTTNNGGTNWSRVPSANIPLPLPGEYGYTDLYASYGNTIWFGTNKGRVFKSADKGLTWTVASTGLTEVTTLGFHNDSIGIATYVKRDQNSGAITGFFIKKSVDGGKKWTTVTPKGKYFKSDMAVVPDAVGMLISTGISQDLALSGSAYSLDEGENWTQLDDSVQYTTVKFYSSSVGWAGGFNENSTSRGIWKWLGIPTTAVKDNPADNVKIKIFPNPARNFVNVYFKTLKQNPVIISIYDIQGKKVKVFSMKSTNSKHQFSLDVSSLRSGTYLMILNSKQNTVKRKLIIRN